jgi:uncharacterized zinc-type alcohol dehydrogenase-like protein
MSMSDPTRSGTTSHPVKAYSAASASSALGPTTIPRREPLADDVEIEILYCGVCHSDVHQVRDDWHAFMPTKYPCVPGHEIVGRVTRVGSAVANFELGDLAAVGCIVDSCRTCANCRDGEQQYCSNRSVPTYNGPDRHLGGVTYGGYSNSVVVTESFCLRISAKLDLAGAAPLLCAGITTYSPLRHWNVRKGQKVGIVGLGGLGHMAVKFAKAFGATTVVFTTSPSKAEDARRLGADEAVLSTDVAQMKRHNGSCDFILDTASAAHDINRYIRLLELDGTMTLVGMPSEPVSVVAPLLVFGRRRLSGSSIGGIRETQEMLDFCAEHGITADVEVIRIDQINDAYERMLKGDVKYRFVIDMSSLPR